MISGADMNNVVTLPLQAKKWVCPECGNDNCEHSQPRDRAREAVRELSNAELLPKSAGGDTRSDLASRDAWSNYAIADRLGVSEPTVRRARAEEMAARELLVAPTFPHVTNNSGENEWYTPSAVIEAARRCMGGIDLDPASSLEAQKTVQAERFFTLETNGLSQPWVGRIWMNPPYERMLVDLFVTKLVSESVEQAIVLVNNATETDWGQTLLAAAQGVCFPAKRIRFLSPDGEKGAPLQGQMICGLGVKASQFIREFDAFGVCFSGCN